MKFCFTLKSSDEAISVKEFGDFNDAVVYFANQKRLAIDDFLKIYNVKLYER